MIPAVEEGGRESFEDRLPEHVARKKELKEKLGRRDSRRHLFLLPAPFVKSTIHPGHYRETFDLKVRAARLTPSASVNRRHNRYVAQSFETGCLACEELVGYSAG